LRLNSNQERGKKRRERNRNINGYLNQKDRKRKKQEKKSQKIKHVNNEVNLFFIFRIKNNVVFLSGRPGLFYFFFICEFHTIILSFLIGFGSVSVFYTEPSRKPNTDFFSVTDTETGPNRTIF